MRSSWRDTVFVQFFVINYNLLRYFSSSVSAFGTLKLVSSTFHRFSTFSKTFNSFMEAECRSSSLSRPSLSLACGTDINESISIGDQLVFKKPRSIWKSNHLQVCSSGVIRQICWYQYTCYFCIVPHKIGGSAQHTARILAAVVSFDSIDFDF